MPDVSTSVQLQLLISALSALAPDGLRREGKFCPPYAQCFDDPNAVHQKRHSIPAMSIRRRWRPKNEFFEPPVV